MVSDAVPRRAAGDALKKALLALVFVALVVLVTVRLTRAPGPPPAVLHGRAAVRVTEPLQAGVGKAQIQLGARPVMAGYAGHRVAESAAPVHARAVAFAPDVFVASIETLLIPGELEEEVLRRAGLPPTTCLLLTATHTHSGPGGFWDNALAGWAGTGAFDRAQRDAIADAAAAALRQAAASLRPAELSVAREVWAAGPAKARTDGAIDPELVVVRAGPATLVAYAMHATSEPRKALRISGDWPAITSAVLSDALVLQGAVGNTTWDGTSTQDLGVRVANEARQLKAPAAPAQVSCETRLLALPPFEAPPTWPLHLAATNLLAPLAAQKWIVQTRLRLGPLELVGVPGEPAGELAVRARPAFLVGLADDYVGYVETAEHWAAGKGEAHRAQYGPSLAHALGVE